MVLYKCIVVLHSSFLRRPVSMPFCPQKYTLREQRYRLVESTKFHNFFFNCKKRSILQLASVSVFQYFILKLYNMSKKLQDEKHFFTIFLIQLFEIKYKIRDRYGL